MSKWRGRTQAWLAVTALAGAGCGNSGDVEQAAPAAQATRTPTKAEFAAATAKICARADRRMGAFIPLGTDPTTRHNSRLGIIGVLRDQKDEMHAAGYPPGSRQKLDTIYRAVDEAMARAEEDDSVDIEKAIDDALSPYAETLQEYTPGCD